MAAQGRARTPGPVMRYLASAKNIFGCLLALVGLVLYFVGVLAKLWPLVVVALYVIGVLVAPRRPATELLRLGFDPSGVRSALNRVRKECRDRAPTEISVRVNGIAETIEGILPNVGKLSGASQELFILQRTATDYLPTAVESYLSLPRDYANSHPIEEGKTARQVLLEQLDLLSAQMNEVADAVARNDVDRLLAHGRFLEERFGSSQLAIEPPDGGEPGPSSKLPPPPPP